MGQLLDLTAAGEIKLFNAGNQTWHSHLIGEIMGKILEEEPQ